MEDVWCQIYSYCDPRTRQLHPLGADSRIDRIRLEREHPEVAALAKGPLRDIPVGHLFAQLGQLDLEGQPGNGIAARELYSKTWEPLACTATVLAIVAIIPTGVASLVFTITYLLTGEMRKVAGLFLGATLGLGSLSALAGTESNFQREYLQGAPQEQPRQMSIDRLLSYDLGKIEAWGLLPQRLVRNAEVVKLGLELCEKGRRIARSAEVDAWLKEEPWDPDRYHAQYMESYDRVEGSWEQRAAELKSWYHRELYKEHCRSTREGPLEDYPTFLAGLAHIR